MNELLSFFVIIKRMIVFVKGRLIFVGDDFIALENSGLGYKVFVKKDVLDSAQLNQEYSFYTSHIIKEDKSDLYGFETRDEVHFFELLNSVSGVGPKSALAILNLDELENLKAAIKNSDDNYLAQVSGIGKKTAKKMILELQDKVESDIDSNWRKSDSDIYEALRAMGYSASELKEVIRSIPEHLNSDSEKIKYALSRLAIK